MLLLLVKSGVSAGTHHLQDRSQERHWGSGHALHASHVHEGIDGFVLLGFGGFVFVITGDHDCLGENAIAEVLDFLLNFALNIFASLESKVN